jgi:hypothetical protein
MGRPRWSPTTSNTANRAGFDATIYPGHRSVWISDPGCDAGTLRSQDVPLAKLVIAASAANQAIGPTSNPLALLEHRTGRIVNRACPQKLTFTSLSRHSNWDQISGTPASGGAIISPLSSMVTFLACSNWESRGRRQPAPLTTPVVSWIALLADQPAKLAFCNYGPEGSARFLISDRLFACLRRTAATPEFQPVNLL